MNRPCPSCGSEWFVTPGVTVSLHGGVTAFESPLTCRSCGAVLADSSRAASPDIQSTVRARSLRVAQTAPGTWVAWQTYPSERAVAARVAASDLRKGKVKTIVRVAGPVDARTLRLPDGGIQVQVTRHQQ